MRASRIVTAVNWGHAFGEVILIVVGILVALAISDWNDQRITRKQELALLEEIRTTLETDVVALQDKLDETRVAVKDMKELSVHLQENALYEPYVDGLFGSVYGMRMTNLSSATYETLKSVGFQSVSDRELRAAIAQVFDYHYQRLEEEHAIEREITIAVMRPYYLRNFVDLRFWENATPINFEEVVSDEYFRNILHYRIEALEANQLDSYPQAIADMQEAIQKIDIELAR